MEQTIEDTDPNDHQGAADTGGDGSEGQEVHAVCSRENCKVARAADVAAAETCRNTCFIAEQAGEVTEEQSAEECAEHCNDDDDECSDGEILCKRRELEGVDTYTGNQHRQESTKSKVHGVDAVIFIFCRQNAGALDDDAENDRPCKARDHLETRDIA